MTDSKSNSNLDARDLKIHPSDEKGSSSVHNEANSNDMSFQRDDIPELETD